MQNINKEIEILQINLYKTDYLRIKNQKLNKILFHLYNKKKETESENNSFASELISFSAYFKDNITYLDWVTKSKKNIDFFTIESSSNFTTWFIISKIQVATNPTYIQHYSCIDYKPTSSVNYYRLRLTYLSGKYSYSGIVSVNYSNIEKTETDFTNSVICQ